MRGEVSLNELYAWLMSRSWNMHKNSEPDAVDLAGSVEELFFARADGLIDDSDLRRALLVLQNRLIVSKPIDADESLIAAQPRFAMSERWLVPQFDLVAA